MKNIDKFISKANLIGLKYEVENISSELTKVYFTLKNRKYFLHVFEKLSTPYVNRYYFLHEVNGINILGETRLDMMIGHIKNNLME